MCCRGAQGWAVDVTEDGCLGWMEVVPLREAGICLAALKAQCCSYNVLTAPTTSPTTDSL